MPKVDPQELIREASRAAEADRWRILMQLMLDRLSAYEPALPVPARIALDTARSYWIDAEGCTDDLEAAQFDCWVFVDQVEGSGQGDLRQARLTRAVLCVLSPDGDDEDLSTFAEWFAVFLNPIGTR